MANKSSYFVVLNRQEDFDPQNLADILSSTLSIPRFDAINRLKHYWGILHETEEKYNAQDLQKKLQKEGLETFVLHVSELKAVPTPIILRKAIPDANGLSFEDKGQSKLLPWSNFILLCAGQVEESRMVTKMAAPDGKVGRWLALTGLTPITAVAIASEGAKRREETKKETNFNFYLDLVAKDDFESVRILGNSFDYSYLGARKEYNVLLNFKNLVLDIAGFLPDIIRNQGVHALETEATMQNFQYNSLDAYEYEKLWLLQLATSTD